MDGSNPCDTPLENNSKLSKNDGPQTEAKKMENVDLQKRYQELVGCLMYLMVSTRPDIAFAIGFLSRFTANPGQKHWKALKSVLRYLNGTREYGVHLGGKISNAMPIIVGYADADFASDVFTRRSTSGYAFGIKGIDEKFQSLTSWRSCIQKNISVSTVEAELKAAHEALKEAIALRRLMEDLQFPQHEPTIIYEDNTGTIFLTKNQIRSNRTKHTDISYNFI